MNIRLSGVMLRFVGYQRKHFVETNTVQNGIQTFAKEYEQLKSVLFDGEGNIRSTHRLFLNGNQIDALELNREVSKEDTLEIITAIAGG